LSSLAAGRIIAAGWPQARVAVLPVGEAGAGFAAAARDALPPDSPVAVVAVPSTHGPPTYEGPLPLESTSRPLGTALAAALAGRPRAVWLDLVADDVHDGGAGLLSVVDALPAGVELVGVVPSDHRRRLLLGLRGITSIRGRAAGADPAAMLAADAELERLATDLGVPDTEGAGACGGVGLAILALGGRLATGPELLLGPSGGTADLVVTGCRSYDFASRGGGVVSAAAALAERLLCPCVVLAEEVLIGGREMRTMGVEAAYPIEPGPDGPTERLRAAAVRIGRSWRW
jgi:glycerate kinase